MAIRKRMRRRRKQRVPRISFKQQLDQHIFKLKTDPLQLNASATGVLALVANDNPSGFQDWATGITAMFDQYKMVSLKLVMFPNFQDVGLTTASIYRPVYTVTDYDDATALVSTATALQYDTVKQQNVGRRFSRSMRFSMKAKNRSDGNEGWKDVNAPTQSAAIKLYGDGFTPNANYATYYVECILVCKGRR